LAVYPKPRVSLSRPLSQWKLSAISLKEEGPILWFEFQKLSSNFRMDEQYFIDFMISSMLLSLTTFLPSLFNH
jgi:hypothetical protein